MSILDTLTATIAATEATVPAPTVADIAMAPAPAATYTAADLQAAIATAMAANTGGRAGRGSRVARCYLPTDTIAYVRPNPKAGTKGGRNNSEAYDMYAALELYVGHTVGEFVAGALRATAKHIGYKPGRAEKELDYVIGTGTYATERGHKDPWVVLSRDGKPVAR